jgi:hypothetical protein
MLNRPFLRQTSKQDKHLLDFRGGGGGAGAPSTSCMSTLEDDVLAETTGNRTSCATYKAMGGSPSMLVLNKEGHWSFSLCVCVNRILELILSLVCGNLNRYCGPRTPCSVNARARARMVATPRQTYPPCTAQPRRDKHRGERSDNGGSHAIAAHLGHPDLQHAP